MWDKWNDSSDDSLRTWSPLWKEEIYDRIKSENKDDRKKYLKGFDFIGSIIFNLSIDPEREKKERSPYHNTFTQYLY